MQGILARYVDFDLYSTTMKDLNCVAPEKKKDELNNLVRTSHCTSSRRKQVILWK